MIDDGRGVPVLMLEAEIYAPGGTEPIKTLKGEQIAGHDPEAGAIVEIVDAETGEQRIWTGFPYNLRIKPVSEKVILPPDVDRHGGRRIIGG